MRSNRRSWLKRFSLAVMGMGVLPQLRAAKENDINSTTGGDASLNGALPLGAFSISLAVKDLDASKKFYEALGFSAFGGSKAQNYLIMKNGNALVGLFQGMFEKNILTFNPGWDENAKKLEKFDDVREIQKRLKASGLVLQMQADEKGSGPGSIMLADPDGNQILIDQHV